MIKKLLNTTSFFCLLALIASSLAAIAYLQPEQPTVQVPASDKPNQVQNSNQTTTSSSSQASTPNRSSSPVPTPTAPPLLLPDPNLSKGAVKEKDRIVTRSGQTFPNRQYKPLLNPNDTHANQWWVAPNGMNQVWGLPYGSRPTKVAIIDTGFALNHQEFTGRWATNGGENGVATSEAPSQLNCSAQGLIPDASCNNIDDDWDGIVDNEFGFTFEQNPSWLNCTDQRRSLDKACNLLDDDSNGYVDDKRGWDFANYDASVQAGQTNRYGEATTHGTMVAGVMGATGNNKVGLAGVNWHSSILPLQALSDDGYGDSYTVGEAIYYAADQGADVISISLGSGDPDPYLRLAIKYAMNRGSIVVAASGNDGCECIVYPANYPEVIAVGASDKTNNPTSFSSYGARLDVLAPGAGITTSSWSSANGSSAYAKNVAGTSFATPFVSGLLALGRSYQPNAKWEEIVGAMLENSNRRTLTASSPHSKRLGYGVTRANTMLVRLKTPAKPAVRHQFGGTPALGSNRIYKCENTLPGSLIYVLSKASQLRYTASPFENYKATQQGWSSREAFYSCIGLPTDSPKTLRIINLPETKKLP